MKQHHPDELKPEQRDRMCPACRVRYQLDRHYSPNYDMLPLDRVTWEKLRRAAESFDRAASNLEAEEGSSGTGDGGLYTAAQFVEFIKQDCEGFKERRTLPIREEAA